MPEFKFNDPDVADGFEPVYDGPDFKIRTPMLQWGGNFSDITVEVAEQLIKEKYNRIREKAV